MNRPHIPAWLMAVLLVLVTIALYWPATRYDFINYDDDLHVTANVQVQNGLTWENLKWALINPVNVNWHPLTMLSHMADCQFFGLQPWGHHFTSVLLHALNTALVFLLFRRLTGAFWRSVLVAALFGWHPLHVESVAWVAERKDVLSGFFGLLALIFHARYAQSKIANRQSPIANYALALLFFALGLMSKPMLVTWPFVMLLLDFWPLNRFQFSAFRFQLLKEKLPFFALATAASVVTFVLQKGSGTATPDDDISLSEYFSPGARVGNALISYCRYLGKMFWPVDLAVFYPHPEHWPLWQILLAGGSLAGVSLLCLALRRRHPFLLSGWLWYIGTLVPVIGLVQVGEQAMADRYTYIPSLGVLIIVMWGACALTNRWRHQGLALLVASWTAIAFCLTLTRQQLGHWRDSEALFRHALAVTENNYLAHINLGAALGRQGQTDEAIRHYYEAIHLKPGNYNAHNNLGAALLKQGDIDEAIRQCQEAIRLKSDYAEAHINLGIALVRKGQISEAINLYQEAIRLKPEFPEAHFNLGNALYKQGQIDDAIRQYQETLRLSPDDIEAHINLGVALFKQGRIDEAIHHLQESLRLNPDNAHARECLATALASKGEPAQPAPPAMNP